MAFNSIIYVKEGSIAKITLNRPKQMNSLSRELIAELNTAINLIGKDNEIKVVIICGSEKFFCVGADLKDLAAVISPEEAYQFLKNVYTSFVRLEKLDKPVLAAISGLALGGGLELALACDLRICSTTASFGVPEIALGAIPAAGGTQKLPRLIGITKATEMVLTGQPINADEAYRIGLVNAVVPGERMMEEVSKMADQLASKPPLALGVAKSAMKTGMNMDLESAIEFERRCAAFLFSTEDLKEGIKAFVERRKPSFTGK